MEAGEGLAFGGGAMGADELGRALDAADAVHLITSASESDLTTIPGDWTIHITR